MKDLIELSQKGIIDDAPAYKVLASDLLKFFIAYPEIIALKNLTIADVAQYAENGLDDENYVLTDLPLNSFYLAISAWLELIIRTAKRNNTPMTEIDILMNIGPNYESDLIRVNQLDMVPFERTSADKHVSNIFGISFLKEFKSVTEPTIIYNILVLKEIIKRCI